MIELALGLVYAAALVWAAQRAYRSPRGVYWRSAAGVAGAALAAAALWALVSPAPAAGFGALVIWCAIVALALAIAVAASLAATLRYAVEALRRR